MSRALVRGEGSALGGVRVIRRAAPDDVSAIAALVHDAYEKYVARIGRTPAPMTTDFGRLVLDGGVWVLETDGEIVGLIVLTAHPDHLLVGNVAVAPARQGQGLGKRLLAFAEAQARAAGLGELRLYTNVKMHENLALYERLGWTRYAEAEQDGFRRVFMRKTLHG